ncbi:MAG: (4Fe-4S)-binding protein [Campylobacterota bacterium]|nr:(4Fe-4S)-binding protein [Campylobacterota bacterium]
MKIKKLHVKVGVILAPFFILISLSGIVLLFRKTELYSKDVKSFLVSFHTSEIIAPFIGMVFGFGLLFMSVTGLYLYFQMKKRQNPHSSNEKEYSNDEITVIWKEGECVHAKECVNRLPLVFDREKQPWIDPSKATKEEIMKTIDACPTNALTYRLK